MAGDINTLNLLVGPCIPNITLMRPRSICFLGVHSKASKAGLVPNINNYLAWLYFPVSQYVLSSFAIILKRKR